MNDPQTPATDGAPFSPTQAASPPLGARGMGKIRAWSALLSICALAGCAQQRFQALSDAGPTAVDESDEQDADDDATTDEPGAASDDDVSDGDGVSAEGDDDDTVTEAPDSGRPDATTPAPEQSTPTVDDSSLPVSPSSPIATIDVARPVTPLEAGVATSPTASTDSAVTTPPVDTLPTPEAGPPPARPTIGQLVTDYESGAIALPAFTHDANLSPPTLPPGELSELPEGVVLLGPGEYSVGTDLVVPEDTVLVLAGGTRLSLASGVSLSVLGQLYALGTPSAPVSFGGTGDGFEEVVLAGGRSELHGCSIRNGQTLLRVSDTFAAPVEIDSCAFDDWTSNGVVLGFAENVWLHDSKLGMATGAIATSSAVVAKNSTFVLQNNKVGAMDPGIDTFDLDDCTEDATSYVLGNVIDQGGQDALAVSNCRMIVANNRIAGFDSDPELSSCIEVKTNARMLLVGNLLTHCADGLIGNDDAYVLMLNNSVVNSARGVHLIDTSRVDIVGNIFWDNERDLSVLAEAAASAEHNIIDASGTGNIVADPLFESRDGLDYHLATGSPARAHDYAYAEQLAQNTPFLADEIAELLELDLLGTLRVPPTIDFGALQED